MEIIDVNIDDIGEAVEIILPDMLGDHGARDQLVGVQHQKLQEGIFFAGEDAGSSASLDLLGHLIEFKVGDFQNRGLVGALTSEQGPDTGQKFVKGEGFGEVIIGSGIETRDFITDGVAGGEHQNRSADLFFAQLAADVEAVLSGEHEIQNDEVVGIDFRLEKSLFSIVGDVHM